MVLLEHDRFRAIEVGDFLLQFIYGLWKQDLNEAHKAISHFQDVPMRTEIDLKEIK
jgi:hypothetical protein